MKKLLSLFFIGFLILVGCSFNDSDAIKFKEEYEDSSITYVSLEIPKDNPFVYATSDEILDIILSGTGIIYFGYPTCPWCRNMLPSLIEAAKENNINKIYYYNVKDERDLYEIVDDKLTKTKEGTKFYYDLLEQLNPYLDLYTITKDNKTYDTLEKRIYVPVVFFIRNAEVIGYHMDTVESHTNGMEKLTETQTQELTNIFNNLMKKWMQ